MDCIGQCLLSSAAWDLENDEQVQVQVRTRQETEKNVFDFIRKKFGEIREIERVRHKEHKGGCSPVVVRGSELLDLLQNAYYDERKGGTSSTLPCLKQHRKSGSVYFCEFEKKI